MGDAAHGGRYKPPQYGNDIRRLLEGLFEWQAALEAAGVPPLIRAPLAHLYFEIIHPFWDGNGRVGRVLEAAILRHAGFRYAPFALSRYYLDSIDEYFSLFNRCRKAADRRDADCNVAFVQFHLVGMLTVTDHLHDRVNRMVEMLIFDANATNAVETGTINQRQRAVIRLVRDYGRPLPLETLRSHPSYIAMYRKLTTKTQRRDLQSLRDLRFLALDEKRRLWPGFLADDQHDGDLGQSEKSKKG